MSLPLTKFQRDKIFHSQQKKIQSSCSEKRSSCFSGSLSLIWLFSLLENILWVSRIMLDRDRSLVIRLCSPPRLDTRLQAHYPLILIMWEDIVNNFKQTKSQTLGPVHWPLPVLAPGGRSAQRNISRVIWKPWLSPFQVEVIRVTTVMSEHLLLARLLWLNT